MKLLSIALLAISLFAADAPKTPEPKPEPVPSISDKDRAEYHMLQFKLAQSKLNQIEFEKQINAELQKKGQEIQKSCPGVTLDQSGELVCPAPPKVEAKPEVKK